MSSLKVKGLVGKMLEKLKGVGEKIDKKALAYAIGLMLMSWAALPLVYILLVRRKKDGSKKMREEAEEKEEEEIDG